MSMELIVWWWLFVLCQDHVKIREGVHNWFVYNLKYKIMYIYMVSYQNSQHIYKYRDC